MTIYFCGIGGVGLGPLALIANQSGHTVFGSDSAESATFTQLKNSRLNVNLDQTSAGLAQIHKKTPIDWLVYSAAVPSDHPQLLFAKAHHIKTSKRDELLKSILQQSGLKLIAVAGTHGKTTTTAMLIWLCKQLKLPVSYLVGAPLSWGSSGFFDPKSQYFIYECDEFDRNFLQFRAWLSLITSIGYDHSDSYPRRKDYIDAFEQFEAASQTVLRWDNVKPQPLGLPGAHNRRNGSLAIAGLEYITGQTAKKLVPMLNNFPGASRRFEKLVPGVYSDYAHHPDEITATLQLASQLSKRIVVVYQPHQNIRQHQLKRSYGSCFNQAQKVYWLPTYLSREDPALPILSPKQLGDDLAPEKVVYSQLDKKLALDIKNERRAGALVVFMGAGDIDEWARKQIASTAPPKPDIVIS